MDRRQRSSASISGTDSTGGTPWSNGASSTTDFANDTRKERPSSRIDNKGGGLFLEEGYMDSRVENGGLSKRGAKANAGGREGEALCDVKSWPIRVMMWVNNKVGSAWEEGSLRSAAYRSSPLSSRSSMLPLSRTIRTVQDFSARGSRTRLFRLVGVLVLLWLGFEALRFLLFERVPSLRLDPLVDPLTFQLRPPGDPSGRIPRPAADIAVAHALEKLRAGRMVKTHDGKTEAWYKGDERLRANRPASRFTCDGRNGQRRGSLLFIGIFSAPWSVSKRHLLRTLFKPDLPPRSSQHAPPLIDLAFISARPENDNWRWLLEQEAAMYGDIVQLEESKENINEGKTARFFEWVASGAGGRWNKTEIEIGEEAEGRDPRAGWGGRPEFVMKADDDGFLVVPNLIRQFKALDCSQLVYWGTSQGSWPSFSPYFRGLAYALSWPLVEWIGTAGMSVEATLGTEDARVGAWLTELDPAEDPVKWVDVGWGMGDWDQMNIDEESIGLHWLKLDEWVPMAKRKILKAWKAKGREYRWDWHEQPNAYPSPLSSSLSSNQHHARQGG